MYIRLSREDGDKQESESIGNQRKILQRYVKENNLVGITLKLVFIWKTIFLKIILDMLQ